MEVRIFITCIYCLIILVGIIFHSLLIYVLTSDKEKDDADDVLVINVSVAALFYSVIVTISVAVNSQAESWILGSFLCQLFKFTGIQTPAVPLIGFTALALEKCICSFTEKSGLTPKYWKILMVISWILGLVLAVPVASKSQLVEIESSEEQNNTIFYHCHGPVDYSFHFENFCLAIVLLALILITICLIGICVSNFRSGSHSSPDAKKEPQRNKMLFLMALVYFSVWLFSSIFFISVRESDADKDSYVTFDVLSPIFHFAIHTNPMLYIIFDEKFRKKFVSVLGCRGKGKESTKNKPDDEQAMEEVAKK